MKTKLNNEKGQSRKAVWLCLVLCATLLLGGVLLGSKPVLAAGKTEALLLSCIDYRFISFTKTYMDKQQGLEGKYDYVILAGGALGANIEKNMVYPEWCQSFFDHIDVAIHLHHIRKIIIIDHRNCGAYREFLEQDFPENPTKKEKDDETKSHTEVMAGLAKNIQTLYPGLSIELWLMGMDGTVESIPFKNDFGQALAFDGAQKNYVDTPHSEMLNAYPLTVEAWIKTKQSSGECPIVNKYRHKSTYAHGNNNGWQMMLSDGQLKGWYFTDDDNTNCIMPFTGKTNVADNNWHHVVFVVAADGGYLYVDGKLDEKSKWSGLKRPTKTSQNVRLGEYSIKTPTSENFYTGQMDEVRVWNSARTEQEIKAFKDFELNGRENGLILYYNFNQGIAGGNNSGVNAANDLSNSRNNGALQNFQLTGSASNWVKPGGPTYSPRSLALDFDGDNDFVSIPHDDALNAYPLTVEAWIKTNPTLPKNQETAIVNKYSVLSNNGWKMYLQEGKLWGWYFKDKNNFIHHGKNSDPAYFTKRIKNPNAKNVADGNWHHVAFVVDGSNGRLYVDGELDGDGTLAWYGKAGSATTHINAYIGNYPGPDHKFGGQLGEVRIWNVARTKDQIKEMMNYELTGKEAGLVAYYNFKQGVAEGDNKINTTLTDAALKAGGKNNGQLYYFGLTGNASNWVAPGSGLKLPKK